MSWLRQSGPTDSKLSARANRRVQSFLTRCTLCPCKAVEGNRAPGPSRTADVGLMFIACGAFIIALRNRHATYRD